MKDQKMLSFRVDSKLHVDFKDFCTRNGLTIKNALTKIIEILLEADETDGKENEKNSENLLDV